jgi:amino acid transporter
MEQDNKPSWAERMRGILVGAQLNPFSPKVHHQIALIAFFAWVGLGSDGLSSSCYGPSEAFMALRGHEHLAIFVAAAIAITIFVIGTSYSQVVELFPTGGGGYLVASKLLSPTAGMVAGSALTIDYVMTIAISIASGTDALFSFLPPDWANYKLYFAMLGIMVLTVANLRGAKESVLPLVPIFLVFVGTHLFLIVYAIATHAGQVGSLYSQTAGDINQTASTLGVWGMLALILRAYSMGAGTYTGLEAVSNGMPLLREPKIHTARKTMVYMMFSLSFVVAGLFIAYLLYNGVAGSTLNEELVKGNGKFTLNALLISRVTDSWNPLTGKIFLLVTLVSEAAILYIAAQTGFLGGPRVLANMALDRWLPTRLALLSDRLVTQNGIFLMGMASLLMVLLTRGSVSVLVVLYSINVFITFTLTQMGLVRHWLNERNEGRSYKRKLAVAGASCVLCTFILVSVTAIKFREGGWITLIITGALITFIVFIRRHYNRTGKLLRQLDDRVFAVLGRSHDLPVTAATKPAPTFDKKGRTAVLLVNGFNGLGLHTLFNINRLFGGVFKNFVFLQVGIVDAGNFKGVAEVERLKAHAESQGLKYIEVTNANGFYGESVTAVTTDVIDEIVTNAQAILAKYPNAVFFGGQMVFQRDIYFSRWLHNNIIFTVQRHFYYQGIPIVILPVRLDVDPLLTM